MRAWLTIECARIDARNTYVLQSPADGARAFFGTHNMNSLESVAPSKEKRMALSRIDVLNPAGMSQSAHVPRAERPQALEGLVVGFLDNTKNNTDRILGALQEAMQ